MRGGQLRRIVAMGIARVDHVLLDDHDRELLEPPDIDLDRLGTPAGRPASVGVAVDDHVVDQVVTDVREERAQMLACREVVRLARLRRHVADVDLHSRRGGERVAHVADEQVRQHAAEQASRDR